MSSNSANSPRQKMINLLYLVFIAMLALNVSSEVLDGFDQVEATMLRSVKATSQHNDLIFNNLKEYKQQNAEKAQQWYDKGELVKNQSDSLFNYIQDLKQRIAVKVDGKNGDPTRIKRPDDLNAAYEVMFERGKNDAKKLVTDIDNYRGFVADMVTNPSIKNIIVSNLSTEPSEKAKENKHTWAESMFWQMPVAGAITMLTKLQNDIRYAEGQVLADLVKNIDVMDYRVNKLEAFVIPETQTVMRGMPYRAQIGLLAQDSTQRPKVFVNGNYLSDESEGLFVMGTGSIGKFPVQGYVEMQHGDGSSYKVPFSSEYFVVQPSATVAPVLMNVLYAGIDNDIQIAVPGVAGQNVTASISNGTLTRKSNDIWAVKPKLGADAVIAVTAQIAGRSQEMSRNTFKIRPLPDPAPYVNIRKPDGNTERYRGSKPLAKSALVSADVLRAAMDDGILDINFDVLRFDLVRFDNMGFRITTPSSGNKFSEQQKDAVRAMQRGQTVLISNIVVRGPDGIERNLTAPMDIRIN